MKNLFAFAALALLFLAGCEKAAQAPEPLSLEQIPTVLREAFASAAAGLKETAAAIGERVQQKDFPTASLQLNALNTDPSLSEPQRSVVARAMVAVNEQLQQAAQPAAEAAAGGVPAPEEAKTPEAKAAEAALKHYRATK